MVYRKLAILFFVGMIAAGSLGQTTQDKKIKINISTAGSKPKKPTTKPSTKTTLKPGYPRSLADIKKAFREIATKPISSKDANRVAALRRVQAYRYLAGVTYDNLVLDAELNDYSQAAAKVCEKLGRLDHRPKKNPGLPKAEFEKAQKGARASNLGAGFRSLVQSVDVWMNDSDRSNISRLGHRRGCLNPLLLKVGFGHSGRYTSMYVFDKSQPRAPNFDMICFPARGYMPVELFSSRHAWSVAFHPSKFRIANPKAVKANIYVADAAGKKVGTPLKLDFSSFNTQPFGNVSCLIFRPASLTLAPGRRYIVEIEGILPALARTRQPVSYPVEFVRIQ